MSADATAEAEAVKARGNKAVADGDFGAAEEHYTAALAALSPAFDGWHHGDSISFDGGVSLTGCDPALGLAEGSGDVNGNSQSDVAMVASQSLRATLLCNRSHARHQAGLWQVAVEDASEALELLSQLSGQASTEKMRIKALYRRALSQEALGNMVDALLDLNLALKMAPSNEGIVYAARRMSERVPHSATMPPRPAVAPWLPNLTYNSREVLRVAESDQFSGRICGFMPNEANSVVKFPCGMGVAVYHGHGGLNAILPLGPPRLLHRVCELADSGKVVPVPGPKELGDEYFERPNMRPCNGLHAKYSKGGDLRWLCRYNDGQLDGLTLRFEPEGFLRYSECGVYRRGQLVEKWQNCLLPDGYLSLALADLVLPVKKALGLGLSPCEERLCFEERVDVDGVQPMSLTLCALGEAPEVPRVVSGQARRTGDRCRAQLEGELKPELRSRDFAPIGPGGVGEAVPTALGGTSLVVMSAVALDEDLKIE